MPKSISTASARKREGSAATTRIPVATSGPMSPANGRTLLFSPMIAASPALTFLKEFFFAEYLVCKMSERRFKEEKRDEHDGEHRPDFFPFETDILMKIQGSVNDHEREEELE